MKNLKPIAALLAVLIIFSACSPTKNPFHEATHPESASESPGIETVGSVLPVESATEPILESATESVSAETEPIPTVTAPPEGTPGVFFVHSFEELTALTNLPEFLTYDGRPVLCITDSFPLSFPVTIPRDADLIYLPAECSGEFPLTIRCDSGIPSLTISIGTELLMESGLLSIDAPSADLTIVGDTLPSDSAVSLYCNVASYNGMPVLGEYGGAGQERLASVSLWNSSVGQSCTDATLTLHGNLAVIGVPLLLHETDVKNARVTFTTDSGRVLTTQTMDLTALTSFTVTDPDGGARTYVVTSERLSYDLPVMEIHTDGGAPIEEKNQYLFATLTIDGTAYPMQIRGRGNASWTYFPKKSYRIKLNESELLLGLPENRDWVLTSNYADKTMLRNCVAHTMAASLSGLAYTSTHIPVKLYLNGTYIGVYTFADKIEEGNGRLDLGEPIVTESGVLDVGFLVEIGWDFDEENVYNQDYFDTDVVLRIFVKEPSVPVANTPEFLSLKSCILNMENAIINDSGWEDWIDVDSWVDWFIMNEITFNTESSFYRSCYLWKEAGGKVHLGPVWDFDMAFGNHYGDLPEYDGWCTTESTYQYLSKNWMNYLMQYKSFTDRLVARWNEVKDDLLAVGLEAVDRYSAMLDGSQQQNFEVWRIMNVGIGMGSVNPYFYDTYEKQVQYVRDFIRTRWQYIDQRLNSDEYRHGDGMEETE